MATGLYQIPIITLAGGPSKRMHGAMGQHEVFCETVASFRETAKCGAGSSVCALLRQDILSGRLTGNERLKVSGLAARHQTTSNPVRLALQQVRGEGLVAIRRHRGARLRILDEGSVRDIHDVEAVIEPYLGRSFVSQYSGANIAQLFAVQSETERLNFTEPGPDPGPHPDPHSRLDRQFPMAMYCRHDPSGALALRWKHRTIAHAINHDHGTSLRRRRDVITEHRDLIQAVMAHDENRTAAFVACHVMGSGRHSVDRMRSGRATAI